MNSLYDQSAAGLLPHDVLRLHKIFDNLPMPCVAMSRGPDDQFIFINQQFVRTFGHTLEDIPAINDWIRRTNHDDPHQAANRAPSEGKVASHELQVICKDGTCRDVIITTNVIEDMRLACLLDITERKRLEDERRLREVRFHLFANNTIDDIWTMSLDGRITYISPSIERRQGYTPEEYMELPLEEMFTPLSLALVKEGLSNARTCIQDGMPMDFSAVMLEARCKDGSTVWNEVTATTMYDSDGRFIEIQGVTRNITKRKQMEAALLESNQLLSLFIQKSPIYAYIKEVTPKESRVLKASDNFQEMIGIPGLKMDDKTMPELYPEAFAAKITADDWAVAASGQPLNLDEEFNGRYYTTLKFPITQGNRTLLAGYTIDITEQKRTQAALAEREELLRIFINHAPAALAMFDREMRYLVVSSRWIDDYRPDGHDIIGRSHHELLKKLMDDVPPQWKEAQRRCLAGDVIHYEEERIQMKDGTQHWIRWDAHPWHTGDGTIGGIIIFCEDITERKQIEDRLRISEEKFRSLVETTSDCIWEVDANRCFTYLSPKFEDLTGYPPQAFIGKSTLALHRSDIAEPDNVKRIAIAAAHQPFTNLNHKIRHRDDRLVFTESHGTPVFDAAGEYRGMRGVTRDVTERMYVNMTLQTSSAVIRLAATAESLEQFHQDLPRLLSTHLCFPVVTIQVYDPVRGELVFAGTEGLPEGPPDLRLCAGSQTGAQAGPLAWCDQPRVELDIRQRPEPLPTPLRELGIVTIITVPIKLGRLVLGNLCIADHCCRPEAPHLIDTLRGVAETVGEASERLEAQAALRQSERQFRRLFDVSPVPLIFSSRNGDLHEFNRSFVEVLGYTEQEIRHVMDWWPLAFPDPDYRAWARQNWEDAVARADSTGTTIEPHEYRICSKDGSTRLMRVSGIVFDGDMLTTLIDITSLKQTQAELEQYRNHLEELVESRTRELIEARKSAEAANQAKSNFLAHMTHELRTPLHAILGFTEVLDQMEDRPRDPAVEPGEDSDSEAGLRRRALLATIQRNGRHLLSLVNDVLDFSRMERGHLSLDVQPTDLHILLRDCLGDLAPLAANKELQLHLELAAELPACVSVDGRRLKQVLSNLLGNAVKFTTNGEVRLTAGANPSHCAAAQVDLRLTVADTGPGIPDADQEQVFAVFTQSDQGPDGNATQGSGLGLAISRQLAHQMGGEISLDSVPGAGSRFTLTLPAVPLAGQAECRRPVATVTDADPRGAGLATLPSLTAADPPPVPALMELRELAVLGRTSRLEAWCRHWSTPERRPIFAAQVLKLTYAFEHTRIVALADAAIAGHRIDPLPWRSELGTG